MSVDGMSGGRYAKTRAATKRGIYVIALGVLLFFGALIALTDFRVFISGPGDGTLSGDVLRQYRTGVLADHRGVVLVGYGLVGVGQVLLGLGAGLVARAVARVVAGWKATLSRAAGPLLLLGGILTFVAYVWPGYWADDAALAGIGESTGSIAFFLAGWVLLALGFVALAIVVMSGWPWPRWAGVVAVLCTALVFITTLPLFFQIGALVVGIGIAVALRPGRLARAKPSSD